MPGLTLKRRHPLPALLALLCLFAPAAAPSIGYLEGRIVDIVERVGARIALVRMAGGEVLEAQLPQSGLFDTAERPEYLVGERVEL